MIIKPFKTYYTVAVIEFDTFYGDAVECRVKGLFDPGAAPQVFKGTGNPLTITMKQSTGDTFDPIKTSEAILSVHNLEDFQALGILAKGNRDYQLEVVYNDVTIWTGFMVPDQWSEPFTAVPYPSEFTFIDGLSMLKNIPFEDDEGCYFRGRRRDYITVGYLLSLIGLDRRFVDQINIIDVNTPAEFYVNETTLFQKFKDVEAFKGMSCYEVLESILINHISRIEFHQNKYWIRRVRDNSEQIKSQQFIMNVGGNATHEVDFIYDNIAEVTCPIQPTRLAWVENTQELFRLPGVRKLTINQNYGRKESIIPRSLFTDCDWQNPEQLKFWNGNGIRKVVVDDETCVEFKAWTPQTNPYEKPAFIEMSMADIYDVTGVDATTGDFFELDIVCRNGTYKPSVNPGDIYTGPRFSSGSTTLMGSGIQAESGKPEFRARESVDIDIKESPSVPGTYYFRLPLSFWDDRGIDYPVGGEKIIFTNVNNSPVGYSPGYAYLFQPGFVLPAIEPTHYYFLLKEDDNPFSFKVPDASDVDDSFNASYFFTYLDVDFEFSGGKLNLFGQFLTFNYLNLEISRNDINNERFFTIGAESSTILSSSVYSSGPLNLRIEKPNENAVTQRGQDGTFFIESVKLTIKDTPEDETEKIIINENNNIDKEINIMFAETPIKNNFRNNNLKYYNNFYSRSTIVEPGLQKIDYVGEESILQRSMYNWIKSDYIALLKNPRVALSGTLDSPTDNPIGKVLGEPFTLKNFIMTSVNWNVYLHRFEGEWHEIGVKDQPPELGAYSNAYSNAYDI